MAGPWERYAPPGQVAVTFDEAPQTGPWSRYAQQPPASPAAPLSTMDRVAQGVGDPIQGGAQFLTRALPRGVVDAVNSATETVNRQPVIGPITRALGMVPATPEQVQQQTVDREAQYQQRRTASGDAPGDTDWGRLAGTIGTGVAAGAIAGLPRTVMGAAGLGATQGAVFGAAEPVADPRADYADTKKQQIETGLQIGAAAGAGGQLVGRFLSPRIAPEVRELDQRGVTMTPGQIMGGAVQRMEDRAQSLPVVGDAIRSARGESLESFNRATADEVLAPLGITAPQGMSGRPLAQFVQQATRQAEQDAIARVQPFAPDAQFAQDIAAAAQRFQTPDQAKWFQGWLRNNVTSRFQNGTLDGASYKEIDNVLGDLARSARSATNLADRETGRIAEDVQAALRGLMVRTNPQAAPAIQAADRAWAMGVRFDLASGMQGASGSADTASGVFTPSQLSYAVRQADPTLRHRGYARGDALLQDLSDAGRRVLPPTVPNSGTPERLLLASMLSGLSGQAGAAPSVTIPMALAGAGVAGAYMGPTARAIQAALLAQRPAPIRAIGDALTVPGVSVPLGTMLLAPPDPSPQQRR